MTHKIHEVLSIHMLMLTHKIHGFLSMDTVAGGGLDWLTAACSWLAMGWLLTDCWLAAAWLLAGSWLATVIQPVGDWLYVGCLLDTCWLAANRLLPGSRATPRLGLPSGGLIAKNLDFTKQNNDFLMMDKNNLKH